MSLGACLNKCCCTAKKAWKLSMSVGIKTWWHMKRDKIHFRGHSQLNSLHTVFFLLLIADTLECCSFCCHHIATLARVSSTIVWVSLSLSLPQNVSGHFLNYVYNAGSFWASFFFFGVKFQCSAEVIPMCTAKESDTAWTVELIKGDVMVSD